MIFEYYYLKFPLLLPQPLYQRSYDVPLKWAVLDLLKVFNEKI